MVLVDRADAAAASPAVVAAVRRDDLLLPAGGWLPLSGRLTVRVATGRVIQLPTAP